jgi:FkbM family methyltransferase
VTAHGDHPANAAARAHRATLPEHNDFDLETLVTLPPYWGWVEHCADHSSASFRMMLGGNDDGVALRLFWNGSYEDETLALWMRLAQHHVLALDIGAHTGVYTLAAHAANPELNVLSFEPDARNYARLALNLRANGCATTDSYMLGLSDADGTGRFTMRAHSDYRSSGGTFETVEGGHSSDLHVAALDSFLPPGIAASVGLIKLDVEGHEPAALTGMRQLITRSRPTLVFECLSDTTARAVSDMLGPLGYHFHEIDDVALTMHETAGLAPSLQTDGSPVASRMNRIAAYRAEDLAIIHAN